MVQQGLRFAYSSLCSSESCLRTGKQAFLQSLQFLWSHTVRIGLITLTILLRLFEFCVRFVDLSDERLEAELLQSATDKNCHAFRASRTCSGEIVFLLLSSQTVFDCAEMSLIHSFVSSESLSDHTDAGFDNNLLGILGTAHVLGQHFFSQQKEQRRGGLTTNELEDCRFGERMLVVATESLAIGHCYSVCYAGYSK